MKIKLKHLIITLLVATSMMSCTQTDLFSNAQQGRYQSVLKFKAAQSVRSVDKEDEITRMDIFLFKDDVLEKIIQNITSFETTPDGYGSIILGSDVEGDRAAYVVANLDNPSLMATLKVGVTTIEEMKGLRTSLLTKMANPPLVMYGIAEKISFSEMVNSSILKLYRVVARIDVVNAATNFVLTDARLINSVQSSSIFPAKASSDISIADFEKIEAIDNQVSLYSYENLQLVADSATSVEVSGTVNGIPLTYKIDLENKSERFPIERNFHYIINVNNVRQNTVNFNISVRPWVIGSDIEETVDGTLPVIVADVDPVVGVYDSVNHQFAATESGGSVVFKAQANAECGIMFADSWVKLHPITRASSIDTLFNVLIEPNTQPEPRTTTIKFFNRINDKTTTVTVTQAKMEAQVNKYMVLVVAGQSNAVGYDESIVFPDGVDKPNPRAFQLSYRYGAINPGITPLGWCAENLQDMTTILNAGGQRGTKGIHLPLANELLKRIPSDYKLLIIPVAYGGTSLLSAKNPSTSYNANLMQPDVMTTPLQWGINRPYNRTMIDRVKSVLVDPDNKFLGVVWCQGENDATQSEAHYAAFNTMTQQFFDQLNEAGYGSRCPKGFADKDLWYNYSSTKYWSDWYSVTLNASPVFGGYKVWNPDTFIHVPFNTSTNESNGNGATSSARSSHFGNNAFRTVIAPMVAECMDNNGGLFNGNAQKNDRFVETDIRKNANSIGGSFDDADLKKGFKAFYPLNGSYSQYAGTALYIQRSNNSVFTTGSGFIGVTGAPRAQSVLKLTGSSRFIITSDGSLGGDWTIAFMFKRTSNFSNASQALISGSSTTPFIGFKKYDKNGGAGNYAEFVVEPIPGNDPLKAVGGQFMDADNVRSPADWVHYAVTYSASSKTVTIYMNGQQVASKSLPATPALNMTFFNVGASSNGAMGDMCNFGVWNTVLPGSTVKKLYLHSYYDFTK